MTDEQLAAYLHLSEAEAAIVIPKLSPQYRTTIDRMSEVEIEIDLWQAGLGPRPQGVLIDFDRRSKRARDAGGT